MGHSNLGGFKQPKFRTEFSLFARVKWPEFRRKRDLYEPLLTAMVQVLPGLGVQSWSPFVTRKSGHIWRIWAEMTQTLMPKSTKVAQIHLPCRMQFRQNSPNFAKFPPKFAKFCRVSAKIRQISQISFHKRALTLNTQLPSNSEQEKLPIFGILCFLVSSSPPQPALAFPPKNALQNLRTALFLVAPSTD